MWFGVFLQAYNTTSSPQTPASDYYITDTLGTRYMPLANPAPNAFTYTPARNPAEGPASVDHEPRLHRLDPGRGRAVFKFPYGGTAAGR